MSRHSLPTTTHTLEMSQIAQLNQMLSARPRPVVTAAELSVAASAGSPGAGLPAGAVLVTVSCSGPPQYPYVYGHFSAGPAGVGAAPVALHTGSLLSLCRALRVHQRWGL